MYDDGSETIIKYHHFKYDDDFKVVRVKKDFVTVFVSVATGCKIGCKMCYLTHKQSEVPTRLLLPEEIIKNNYGIVKNIKSKNIKISFMGIGEGIFLHDCLNDIAHKIVGNKNLKAVDVGTMLPFIHKPLLKSLNGLHNGKFFFSLHSAIQKTRDTLINSKVTLDQARNFMGDLNIQKVCHYLILEGVNDTKKELNSAIRFCKDTNSQFRILEFNKIGSLNQSDKFKESVNYIRDNYDNVKMCYSSGKKIKAACGMFF